MIEIKGMISSEETAKWWREENEQKSITTPEDVKDALEAETGDIVEINLNSGGGEVFSGSEIYNLLRSSDKEIHINITGLAGSAASVIACAGDVVKMSPVSYIMIHNAWGGSNEDALATINEGILNAYVLRTGLERETLRKMMDAETFISAGEAVEMGFADGLMYEDDDAQLVAKLKGETNMTDKKNEVDDTKLDEILELVKSIDTRLTDIESKLSEADDDNPDGDDKKSDPAGTENAMTKEEIVDAVIAEFIGK